MDKDVKSLLGGICTAGGGGLCMPVFESLRRALAGTDTQGITFGIELLEGVREEGKDESDACLSRPLLEL